MKYYISVFWLIGFLSCSNIIRCLASSERLNHITESNDSLNTVVTVKGFLNWYKINYKKSSAFRLVGSYKTGYYFVDRKNCKKYLNHLKSSGYISDEYLQKWRNYFSNMEQNFRDNPQNEGPPEGFDYDLVILTQEPDLVFNAVETLKFKIIEKTDNSSVLQMIGEWTFIIRMSKVKGKWLIDNIEIL